MARKELSKEDVKKFIEAYAKRYDISIAEAEHRVKAVGVSRLKTLKKYSETHGSNGKKKKKAAKKAGSKKASAKKGSKKAAKKTSKKVAETMTSVETMTSSSPPEWEVVEGEEG